MSDATQDPSSGSPPVTTAFTLSCRAPQTHAVFLAGTFNGWRLAAMQRDESGRWSTTPWSRPFRRLESVDAP